MQDFRSSSILPSQKNFINLFPQKKKWQAIDEALLQNRDCSRGACHL